MVPMDVTMVDNDARADDVEDISNLPGFDFDIENEYESPPEG